MGTLLPSSSGSGLAVDLARRPHLGQHRPRHVQQRQQLVVPLLGVDVEQQRAAGVADVGDVLLAAGQPPDQEAVHGAEQDLAAGGAGAQAIERVEQVLDLGAGEIRVDHQAGLLAECRLVPVGLQAVADRRGHAALPDDGVGHRLAGGLLPQDGGLALIGDADGREVGGGDAGFGEHVPRRLQLRGPDRLRIVLDMPGAGEDLRELLLGLCDHPSAAIEDDAAARGRALIEGEDEAAHARTSAGSERPTHTS